MSVELVAHANKEENAFAGISIDRSRLSSRGAERRPAPIAILPKSGGAIDEG